ncbi:MAG: CBS domain-containing protein, partial [Thaumarchaeota archaeon]|nr:CBS domain-containing protein [Nitrososphaerota archaeon]
TIMSKNGIGGLPVVSGSGKLVGIITKADVVRACAQ